MNLKSSEFGEKDLEVLEKSTVFQGFFRMLKFRVRHRLFNGEWSETISRELFQRGDAAAAVLYDPKRDVIGLIEQFRIGAIESEYGPWCLEVVAGMVENNESPEMLIRRELEEEAGITEAQLIPISSYFSTPGGCSEKIHLYCALCDLKGVEGIYGLDEESEDIRLQVYSPESVFADMFEGRTNNAATLIGLQWLQVRRESLRGKYGDS